MVEDRIRRAQEARKAHLQIMKRRQAELFETVTARRRAIMAKKGAVESIVTPALVGDQTDHQDTVAERPSEPATSTLRSRLQQLFEAHDVAETEIEKYRRLLIERRGGEECLTEDDLTLLENMEDIAIALRQDLVMK